MFEFLFSMLVLLLLLWSIFGRISFSHNWCLDPSGAPKKAIFLGGPLLWIRLALYSAWHFFDSKMKRATKGKKQVDRKEVARTNSNPMPKANRPYPPPPPPPPKRIVEEGGL